MTESVNIVERGELLPLDSIYPNRLNPNEMDSTDLFVLKNDVRVDNYDPITVSPLGVFYTPEAREDPRVRAVIPDDIDPESTYIICDGFHRYTTASQLKMTHIRGKILHMTERDAMPFFYRRHKLRGKLDPIKEAELFRNEMKERRITAVKLVELYNLRGISYIKTRLSLLNVTTDVVNLFYEPPEDLPGRLTTDHLRTLSYLPKNMHFAVAMMSLERNWRVKDLRVEIRRIKEGKGLRAPWAETEAPGAPPSSHPTMAQRYLHRMLTAFSRPMRKRLSDM